MLAAGPLWMDLDRQRLARLQPFDRQARVRRFEDHFAQRLRPFWRRQAVAPANQAPAVVQMGDSATARRGVLPPWRAPLPSGRHPQGLWTNL